MHIAMYDTGCSKFKELDWRGEPSAKRDSEKKKNNFLTREFSYFAHKLKNFLLKCSLQTNVNTYWKKEHER